MLWLHVGPPKTGSSAIQAYLRARREALAARGVFYGRPLKEEKADGAVREAGNGFELGWWLQPLRRPERFSAEAFERGFRDAFVSAGHPVSLVSSELIAGAPAEALARLRDGPAGGVETGVIGFARDVYGHALSSWMHAIKHSGGVHDFETHCRSSLYEGPQAGAFAALAEAFGRERVRLVHYDTVKDDIVAGFFQALGVEPPPPTRAPLANRGLSPVELEVVSACNRLHANRDGLSLAISRHITSSRPGRAAPVPYNPRAAEILAGRFGEDVERINADFFGGAPVLGLGLEAARAVEEAPDVDAGQVWHEAAEALLHALDEKDAEIRRARAEVQALKAMEKRRRGEAKGARRLAALALELDPDNETARALMAKLEKAQSAEDA